MVRVLWRVIGQTASLCRTRCVPGDPPWSGSVRCARAGYVHSTVRAGCVHVQGACSGKHCACRRAYHASWPGLDEEQRVALIASKGSLSLKQARPRGYN